MPLRTSLFACTQTKMGGIKEQIAKLREHVPDDKTDGELRAVIEQANGDEVSSPTATPVHDQRAAGAAMTRLRLPFPTFNRPSSRGR